MIIPVLYIVGRHPHFTSICELGEKLHSEGHVASKSIGARVTGLQGRWKKLDEMSSLRRTRLEEAAHCQQVGCMYNFYIQAGSG